jgi:sugar porter (SP) family MFS transporter
MVTFYQLAIVIGILASFFVNFFIATPHTEEWNVQFGWRWMFGAEAVPAILFLILLFFVPESPRWFAKQGRHNKAFAILSRAGSEETARAELADIEDTIAHEEGSILQLLKPGFINALMVGVLLAFFSQCTGINVFMYYAPEIFKKLEVGTNIALLQTVFIGSVNLTFTFVAIKLIDKVGRKILLHVGLIGMAICLFAMSFATMFQKPVWMLIFALGYIASFAGSMGPVTWTMLAEIFPTRARGRAMSIATFTLWATNYIVSQTFPMMNENPVLVEKFHHAFPFWVYGGLCILAILFSFIYVPETKGKTLEDIERFWIHSAKGKI